MMSSIDQICDRPTVLVIDDDPSVAVAIKRVLKGIVRLISADNAKTGRDLIVAMPSIDLVILDIYLPGYDAIGLLSPHFPDGFVNQCHEMKILL